MVAKDRFWNFLLANLATFSLLLGFSAVTNQSGLSRAPTRNATTLLVLLLLPPFSTRCLYCSGKIALVFHGFWWCQDSNRPPRIFLKLSKVIRNHWIFRKWLSCFVYNFFIKGGNKWAESIWISIWIYQNPWNFPARNSNLSGAKFKCLYSFKFRAGKFHEFW